MSIRDIGKAIKCFLDWPMLHTRIYVYAYLIFAMHEIDTIRITNSDSKLHYNLSEYLATGMLFVIGFYVSPKVAEYIMGIVSARFGVAPKPPEVQPPKQQ